MKTYEIFRRHTSDQNAYIVATVSTKSAARKLIRETVATERKSLSVFNQTAGTLGDVTNTIYSGATGDVRFSIGYWFQIAA